MTGRAFLRLRTVAVLAAAALLLSSCALLPSIPPQTFTLSAPTAIPNLRGSTSAQLLVTEPTALDAVNTERIVVIEGTQLSYYPRSQWVDRLPVLLQAKIVQTFADTGRAPAVGRPGEGLSIDYALLVDIRAFHYDPDAGLALVALFAQLMNDRNGRVVTTRLFTASAAVARDNAGAVAAALDLALQQVLGEIVNWTFAAI